MGIFSSKRKEKKPVAAKEPPPEPEPDYIFKILLIGDMNVGKTSLLIRFCEKVWRENEPAKPPIECVGQAERIVMIEGKRIKIVITDTAGTERFRTISSNDYKDMNGLMVVFSLADKDTLLSCRTTWIRELDNYAPQDAVKLLIGNKSDLPHIVESSRAKTLATEHEYDYIEVSAKEGTNVDQCFIDLAKAIKDKKEGINGPI